MKLEKSTLDVVYAYLCKILYGHDERLRKLELAVELLQPSDREQIEKRMKCHKKFDVERLPI